MGKKYFKNKLHINDKRAIKIDFKFGGRSKNYRYAFFQKLSEIKKSILLSFSYCNKFKLKDKKTRG